MKRIVTVVVVTLLFVSMLTSAMNIKPVRADGTITINADGSISPPIAPIYTADDITYTLTGNVAADTDGIVIWKDGVTLDGAGYTVQGPGANSPFKISGISINSQSVTIKNVRITSFDAGVSSYSDYNTISSNTLTSNTWGVELWDSSSHNIISGNHIFGNAHHGVELFSASYNTISDNEITGNGQIGIRANDFSNDNSILGNTITENVYSGIYFAPYLTSSSSSSGNTISGNNVKNNGDGIYLLSSSGNTLSNNDVTANSGFGITLWGSSGNTLVSNVMAGNKYNLYVPWIGGLTLSDYLNSVDTSNTVDGKPVYYWINMQDMTIPSNAGCVILVNCARITVQGLTLKNSGIGVRLAYTTGSTVTSNNLADNLRGIVIDSSSNNKISANNIANSEFGIRLVSSSSGNTVSGNKVTNNNCGVEIQSSSGNTIDHNNFIGNSQQVSSDGSANAWDNGYPSGGNYWGDYATRYPSAAEIDSSGLWNIPYVIDANNKDNYPLTSPWSSPPLTYTITIAPGTGGSVTYSSSYGSGTVSSGSRSLQVPLGAEISLVAYADTTHTFRTWQTSGSVSIPATDLASESVQATVNGNGGVTANFGYLVVIQEVGLPTGTSWAVTYGVVTKTSTSELITFTVPSAGEYPFYPSCSGYMAIPSTVNINVPVSIGSYGTGSTNVIFVPNYNYFNGGALEASWDPVKDSYSVSNSAFSTVWSYGNCYGFSSTALLYFMNNRKGDTTYPYFPSQNTQAHSTSDLDLSAVINSPTTLNNAALAIMLHQAYDPNAYPNSWIVGNRAQNFGSLKSSLKDGFPMVMDMWSSTGKPDPHSVVAWSADLLENGKWAIAVYNPNYPESTQVATYDTVTDTFVYTTPQGPYDNFCVMGPATIRHGLPYWVSVVLGGEPWYRFSVTGYYIVLSDKMATVDCNGQEDSFTAPGDSRTLVHSIPGSSGIEEIDAQIYAIPESEGWPTVDPVSNESITIITYVDIISGQPVGYVYLLNATASQGPLDYTVTPSGSGISINAGNNALNMSVIFFYTTQQDHYLFQSPIIPLDVKQTLSFTVINWQTLNNTSPQPVTWTIKASAPSVSVGGEWNPITLQALSPMNTLQLLAPWLSLALTMASVASFAGIRRKRKRQH